MPTNPAPDSSPGTHRGPYPDAEPYDPDQGDYAPLQDAEKLDALPNQTQKRSRTSADEPSLAVADTKRRRKTKTAHILRMPLGLWVEVFSFLFPFDLLYLARVNQFLRCILTSKNSRFIWEESFSNFENFPEKPMEISLPALAALLFDPVCSVKGCRARKNIEPDFQLMRKLCKKHFLEMTVPLYKARKAIPWQVHFLVGIPGIVLTDPNRFRVYKAQLSAVALEVKTTWPTPPSEFSDEPLEWAISKQKSLRPLKDRAHKYRAWYSRYMAQYDSDYNSDTGTELSFDFE